MTAPHDGIVMTEPERREREGPQLAVRPCPDDGGMKLGNGVIKHDPGFSSEIVHSEVERSNCRLGRSRVEESWRENHLADGANRIDDERIVERHLVGDPLVIEIGARRAQHDCFDPICRRPPIG